MACGLPVITTTHTAGPEVMQHGLHGFITEPGDDAALLDAMVYFAEKSDRIETMGRAAREAVLPFTWDAYGDRWSVILERVSEVRSEREK